MAPMVPICRSRTTRSGSSSRTAGRTAWPLLTRTSDAVPPIAASRSPNRSSESVAMRYVVTAPTLVVGLLRIGIAGTVTVGGVGEDDGGQRPQRLEVADLEGLHRHLHHRRRGDPLGQTGQVLGLTRGQVQRVGQAAVVVAQGGAGQRLGPGPNRRRAQGDPDRTIGALAGTVAER